MKKLQVCCDCICLNLDKTLPIELKAMQINKKKTFNKSFKRHAAEIFKQAVSLFWDT